MDDRWTKEQSAAARAEGWDVFEIWDQSRQRIEFEIQRTDDSKFPTDEAAREFVKNKRADEIKTHAVQLVFRSKTGVDAKKRGK